MTSHPKVTAVVLAGGRSDRFGGPKLEVELDGASLVERAVRTVAAIADEVVVAGPPLSTLEPLGEYVRVVADDEPFAGPLAALAGVLGSVTNELAILVGGDMPALAPDVLVEMLQRLISDPDVDAVVLQAPSGVAGSGAGSEPVAPVKLQVLPLALRVGPASIAARDAMHVGDRSLVRLLGRLRSIELPAAAWLALDPAGGTLLDVDVPADLDRIRERESR